MATIRIHGEHLLVEPTFFEKVAGLRGDQRVPLADVADVAVADDPHAAIEGVRAPGLGIPRRTKIGTWRARGRRTYACVRRSEPAVVIDAPGADRFQRYVVSQPDPAAIATRIARTVGLPEPTS